MLKKIHEKYHKGELTLRDYLAAHRTILANDRTWLSYIRTALTLFVAGVSFIKFFKSPILCYTGWVFIPISIMLIIIGFLKHHKRSNMVEALEKGDRIY
jgi:putative membrane protein